MEKASDSGNNPSIPFAEPLLNYARSNILYGTALRKSGLTVETETLYVRIMPRLTPFVDNRCNLVHCRALPITYHPIQTCFMPLRFIMNQKTGWISFSNTYQQYVREHQSMVNRWAISLQAMKRSETVANYSGRRAIGLPISLLIR